MDKISLVLAAVAALTFFGGTLQAIVAAIELRKHTVQSGKKKQWLTVILILTALTIIFAGASYISFTQSASSSNSGITATATPSNSAQQTSTQNSAGDHTNPYPPHIGNLSLEDPMTDSSRGDWQDIPGDAFGEACKYEQDGYHVITVNSYKPCHAYNNDYSFSNFTFEVQMTILSGSCGGISLRDDAPGTAYYFRVCQDGTYLFRRFDTLNSAPILTEGNSSAIYRGLNQANIIAVVANGSDFDLYINYQKVASWQDGKYSSGAFGVSAEPHSEVVYTNARLWK